MKPILRSNSPDSKLILFLFIGIIPQKLLCSTDLSNKFRDFKNRFSNRHRNPAHCCHVHTEWRISPLITRKLDKSKQMKVRLLRKLYLHEAFHVCEISQLCRSQIVLIQTDKHIKNRKDKPKRLCSQHFHPAVFFCSMCLKIQD